MMASTLRRNGAGKALVRGGTRRMRIGGGALALIILVILLILIF
jgi:hypothetical protein